MDIITISLKNLEITENLSVSNIELNNVKLNNVSIYRDNKQLVIEYNSIKDFSNDLPRIIILANLKKIKIDLNENKKYQLITIIKLLKMNVYIQNFIFPNCNVKFENITFDPLQLSIYQLKLENYSYYNPHKEKDSIIKSHINKKQEYLIIDENDEIIDNNHQYIETINLPSDKLVKVFNLNKGITNLIINGSNIISDIRLLKNISKLQLFNCKFT
jgi:hypothetical protein